MDYIEIRLIELMLLCTWVAVLILSKRIASQNERITLLRDRIDRIKK